MLGSCYFVPKGKSWREWPQQQLFLYSEEKGRNKADCLERQSSLCMESRLPRVKTHKVETTAGVKNLNGNWGVTGGSLENSELTTPGDPVSGALPQHCDIYLQELHQIPTVNTREKSPRTFCRGSWNKNHFEIHQRNQFFCHQGKPVNQSLPSWGIIIRT